MRYCEQCGYVMDELCFNREEQNCPKCGWMWTEDDMTALKYADLSEAEKDTYDEQLIKKIRSSPIFCKSFFEERNNPGDGNFWGGFRVDKWKRIWLQDPDIPAEGFDRTIEDRKNRTFRPFPRIDKERARKHALEHLVMLWGEDDYIKKSEMVNVPRCPVCQSDFLCRISTARKIFSAEGSDMTTKTYECGNCGYIF